MDTRVAELEARVAELEAALMQRDVDITVLGLLVRWRPNPLSSNDPIQDFFDHPDNETVPVDPGSSIPPVPPVDSCHTACGDRLHEAERKCEAISDEAERTRCVGSALADFRSCVEDCEKPKGPRPL